MGCGGASGDLFEAAEGLVHGLGVGEGVEEVGCEEDEICSRLRLRVMLAADTFAEVEAWPWRERIEFNVLLHTVVSPAPWLVWLDESNAGSNLSGKDKEQAIAR